MPNDPVQAILVAAFPVDCEIVGEERLADIVSNHGSAVDDTPLGGDHFDVGATVHLLSEAASCIVVAVQIYQQIKPASGKVDKDHFKSALLRRMRLSQALLKHIDKLVDTIDDFLQ